MTLEMRVAWVGASWVVCRAAELGWLNWAPVAAMAVGAWFLREAT